MRENQATVVAWADATFGKRTFNAARRRMIQEICEIPVVPEEDEARTVEEMADAVITMYAVAEAAHLDLHDVIDAKMQINRRRKWKLHGDGTGQHIP